MGLTGFPCMWMAKSQEAGLTGFGCQQQFRVVFRCVFCAAVGWTFLLGPVALQWLRGFGKSSLRRCSSNFAFIAEFLSRIFIGSHSPPLSGSPFRSFKGNESTHRRQNHGQAKSTNHQTKSRKPQRAPPAHMQALPEPMQLPPNEYMQTTSQNRAAASALLWPVRPVDCNGQTSAQDHRLGWWSHVKNWELHKLKISLNPLGNLLNTCNMLKHAQTSPSCWQRMNELKNAKKAT
jgi:hypothetical protein